MSKTDRRFEPIHTSFPRCGECGGTIQWMGGTGRTYEFLRHVKLPIPDDFKMPTCTDCGERFTTVAVSDELQRILGESVARSVRNGGRLGPRTREALVEVFKILARGEEPEAHQLAKLSEAAKLAIEELESE